jgi:GAF domain-containing protein
MTTTDPLTPALTEFARTLAQGFEITDMLFGLTEKVVEILQLPTAGVSLVHDGIIQHAVSYDEIAASIELVQQHAQRGPCVDAYRTNAIVAISDLRKDPDQWPEVQAACLEAGVFATAGVPFSAGDRTLGALNLYDTTPHEWTESELAQAQVLADMATGYLVTASQLQQERRLNEQLQRALESRVVIEQAKGILAAQNSISLNRAFERIRTHARSHNVSVRAVADAVVNLGLRP